MDGLSFSSQFAMGSAGIATALVPLDLIWTEHCDITGSVVPNRTPEWDVQHSLWNGRPLASLTPHIELFECFSRGQPVFPQAYRDWYRALFDTRGLTPPLNDADLLHDRHERYRFFDHTLRTQGVAAPSLTVCVKWLKDRNLFMLQDGHHRATFLHTRGQRQIAAAMPFEDLSEWLNITVVRDIHRILAAQERKELYTPILNPLLFDLPTHRDFASRTRLEQLLRHLGPGRLPGPVLDIGSNIGFFCHHLAREGVKAVGVEPDPDHHALACAISGLYRLKPTFHRKTILDFFATDQTLFAGCLMLTFLYHFMASGEAERVLDEVNKRVEYYVVWESGHDPEAEKALIQGRTKFADFTLIGGTQGTGRSREFGIFHVPGFTFPTTTPPQSRPSLLPFMFR
ncbi:MULTISPECIES: hypothetical protein [unclassified Chelatococcus]|uniref:class I SAM-dependent methyltransferase n=1 Tax=unclassified Chelatococcus TaxID=2638111 RepID=UPI001BCB2A30|nr:MULTISPECIES: hypothetical protein [unclassified Chelatococcus]MBS7698485.1 class I SAM-dependent methyltransferase [Chelatococcus sp. YT9]MBX3554864.1 class I SAM-dependent methyltransferase [Chelatococcus sp.]